MKIPSIVILVGLTISFGIQALAQQRDTPNPQLREQLIAAIKKHTDALDKNDAGAVAANFTTRCGQPENIVRLSKVRTLAP